VPPEPYGGDYNASQTHILFKGSLRREGEGKDGMKYNETKIEGKEGKGKEGKWKQFLHGYTPLGPLIPSAQTIEFFSPVYAARAHQFTSSFQKWPKSVQHK